MHVLVTHVDGPVGSRCAARLRAAGHGVAALCSPSGRPTAGETLPWPDGPSGWDVALRQVDVALLLGPVDAPGSDAGTMGALDAPIAAAGRVGLRRAVLLSSASVYDPHVLTTGTASETTPCADAATADAEVRAWLRLEGAMDAAQGVRERLVLRSLQPLGRDIGAARKMVRDAWQRHEQTWRGERLQGVDVDELADMAVRACMTRDLSFGLANIGGPVAISSTAALAEIERLRAVLSDEARPGTPWRPDHPPTTPVLDCDRARAWLGLRPRRPVWHSLAEVMQEVVAEDRDARRLPPRRSRLPPSVAALRRGERRLAGKNIVVSDVHDAVGHAVVEALRRLGADVVAIPSPPEPGAAAGLAAPPASDATAERGRLETVEADLARAAETGRAARDIAARHPCLHGLVLLPCPPCPVRAEAEPGIERTFARGVLAPCMLTELLGPALFAAPAARVVTVVDTIHAAHPLDLLDLQGRVLYDPVGSLGRAMTGRFLLSRLFAERAGEGGVRVLSVAPSPSRGDTWRMTLTLPDDPTLPPAERRRREIARNGIEQRLAAPEVVAAQIVDAMIGADPVHDNGGFLLRGRPAPPPAVAEDRGAAERLWAECSHLAAQAGARETSQA